MVTIVPLSDIAIGLHIPAIIIKISLFTGNVIWGKTRGFSTNLRRNSPKATNRRRTWNKSNQKCICCAVLIAERRTHACSKYVLNASSRKYLCLNPETVISVNLQFCFFQLVLSVESITFADRRYTHQYLINIWPEQYRENEGNQAEQKRTFLRTIRRRAHFSPHGPPAKLYKKLYTMPYKVRTGNQHMYTGKTLYILYSITANLPYTLCTAFERHTIFHLSLV